jgi:hypothetical protein
MEENCIGSQSLQQTVVLKEEKKKNERNTKIYNTEA